MIKNYFDLMKSTYDNLLQKAPSFDYAVFYRWIGRQGDTLAERRGKGKDGAA